MTVPFIATDGGYWGIAGFSPVRATGTATLAISATDASGADVQTASIAIPVLPGSFLTDYATQEIRLPPDKQGLTDPAVQRRENQYLAPIFSHFTPQQLWRGRFIYPASGFVLTTGFGERRIVVGQPGITWHEGLDLALPEGTPFVAANDGVVVLAQAMTVRGNLTIIDHGLGVFSAYLHQSRFGVTVGQTVHKGEVIGYVGTTGYSTGPHLHWEMRVHNVYVDPDEWTKVSFGA